MSGLQRRHGKGEKRDDGSGELVCQLCVFCANHHYVPSARARTIRERRDFLINGLQATYGLRAPATISELLYGSTRLAPCYLPWLRERGRLINAADQTLQPQCESPPLGFRKEAAQLALTAVRLDREPARM